MSWSSTPGGEEGKKAEQRVIACLAVLTLIREKHRIKVHKKSDTKIV